MQAYLDVFADDLAGMTMSQTLAIKAIINRLKPYLPPHGVYTWVHTEVVKESAFDMVKSGRWQIALAQAEDMAEKFAGQDVYA